MYASSTKTREPAPVGYWSARTAAVLLLLTAIGVLYLDAPAPGSPLSIWLPTLRHAAADLLGALMAFKGGTLLKRGEWRAIPPRVRRGDMRDMTLLFLLFGLVAFGWPYGVIFFALAALFVYLPAIRDIRVDEKAAETDRLIESIKASSRTATKLQR